MLRLVCIDVDGTLVGPSGEPTAAVWAAVGRALERGQHLAMTTARGAFGPTYQWARRLDPAGWHIFHAGGALVHTGTSEVEATALDASVVASATALSDAHGWTLEFYSARDYAVNSGGALAVEHAALMGVAVTRGCAADVEAPIVRVQFVVPHGEVPAVVTAMSDVAEVSTATSPVMHGATFVSITPRGATKAAAIADVARYLGIGLGEVMMVGDGHNDLEAVTVVGHGVAMGNAEPEVLAAAAHVVAPVTEDGLAQALDLSADL